MTLKLWTKNKSIGIKQSQLTNTFLILEKLMNDRKIEKELTRNDYSVGRALRRLLDKGYIKRDKIEYEMSKRKIFVYYITSKGRKEYIKMRKKYFKDIKPIFINSS